MSRTLKSLGVSAACCCALLFTPAAGLAQYGATNGEWRSYGGDVGSTKYSPLDQIDRSNFKKLEIAWRWESISTQVAAENPRVRPGQFKVIPLVVDGVVYVATELSQVAAIDAGTGKIGATEVRPVSSPNLSGRRTTLYPQTAGHTCNARRAIPYQRGFEGGNL